MIAGRIGKAVNNAFVFTGSDDNGNTQRWPMRSGTDFELLVYRINAERITKGVEQVNRVVLLYHAETCIQRDIGHNRPGCQH